jgi:hypothetical protein
VKIQLLDHRRRLTAVAVCLAVVGVAAAGAWVRNAEAAAPRWFCRKPCPAPGHGVPHMVYDESGPGAWHWLRSPEQEQRVVASLYNRYCVRCHGVDGRGVWDMPDVPNFTNLRWQASRSDPQLARIIVEGRGAVMPAFRGTFTLEESWAMARYLRSFSPDAAISRPDLTEPESAAGTDEAPEPPSP